MQAALSMPGASEILIMVPCCGLPVLGIVLIVWLLRKKRADDRETRCRKCGYILRGITEPRCPECGEKI
jgi:hypothetical protein